MFFVCKTLLNDNINDIKDFLNNYNIYRSDRAKIGEKMSMKVPQCCEKYSYIGPNELHSTQLLCSV